MLTNPDIKPTNQLTADEKINDKYFRTVLILLFSMGAIGFVVRRNLSGGQMLVGCLYGIVSMVLMLEGNRYLWMLISTYLEWHKKPVKRIAAMLLSIFLYTTLLGILIYKGWQFLFGGGIINNDQLILIIAGMIFWVLIITHLYESAFLVKQSANDIIRKEQLERLSAEAELELLKSQIDPHFMFNSLNTLSHLITANPERAKIFNDALADVYRYILVNKGQKLVVLEEEINFLKNYLSLLKIRFENAVQFNLCVEENVLSYYLIPPISLQILLENAVKHNGFNEQEPLIITLEKAGNSLIMKNRIVRKDLSKPSAGTGLSNLKERYRHLTGLTSEVQQNDGYFSVNLPILKLR